MNIDQVVPWLATLASGASIAVSLYVKSVIGPIVTEQKTHAKLLDERREADEKIWIRITGIGERLAHVEAKVNGKQGD